LSNSNYWVKLPVHILSNDRVVALKINPDQTTSQKLTLIGGGFGENLPYPLTVNGTLQSGTTFAYTKQVQIVAPPNK
jgi:hypothetical protein